MIEMDTVPTRERLLGLVDDVELLMKELIENAIAPKQRKMSSADHDQLTALLVDKDSELKDVMRLATEQCDVEKNIQALATEVKRQDDAIKELQKKFKDAETLLSTAIFQANQKLESIERAKVIPVPSEDLIKYAHRISASNAVCAPLTWQQGDPRRPYPTDMEMRLGFLSRPESSLPTLVSNSVARPTDFHFSSSSPHPMMKVNHPSQPLPSSQPAPGQFSWQDGEVSMTTKDGTSVPIETSVGDVDVMSTDSSSSSSTDSN